MERQNENTNIIDRKAFIESAYAEKRGRMSGAGLQTLYVNIHSPMPNLAFLTRSLLGELRRNTYLSYEWANCWDKTIISVAPDMKDGARLLYSDDSLGKNFIPVSTTRMVNSSDLIQPMPECGRVTVGINDRPMTTEAFLITYFHMVSELIWDSAVTLGRGTADLSSYDEALRGVVNTGFTTRLISEIEIIKAKTLRPELPVRIYGSRVNRFVPEIMGIVMKG